jgi:hypothetical protein
VQRIRPPALRVDGRTLLLRAAEIDWIEVALSIGFST